MKYKLFHYPCYNSSPEIKVFDLWNELEDYLTEEVERRVQFQVDHSPFSISEKEREEIEEEEWTLVKIEEL
tara:strand:+ start:199 stop:411 length:213 start_codon:yes stop_codon:yes gene_type:complete